MTGPTSDGSRGSLGTDPPLDELRERERRLAEAQRLARTGSWDWDIAADRASWSDELYRILGLEPQEVAASCAELLMRIHPDDVPLVESAVLRARTVKRPTRCGTGSCGRTAASARWRDGEPPSSTPS